MPDLGPGVDEMPTVARSPEGDRPAEKEEARRKKMVMTEHEFRELLAAEGYDEIRETNYAPKSENELHTHEFSALLMVLEGEFILAREYGRETLLAGQTCDVPAGTVHAECTSESGARVLAGIKRTTA